MSFMNERQECVKKACKWTGTMNECAKKEIDSWSSEHVCLKCGGNDFYFLPEPIKNDRVEHANELIRLIASCGREFFRNGETVAHMEIDKRGKVWFVDEFTRCRIYTHYRGDWRGFNNGGTMRNLVVALRNYITKSEKLNPRVIAPKRFYEDGSNIWGYEPSEAEALRQSAWKLPMFPQAEEQGEIL
jgi:hypothetical protein